MYNEYFKPEQFYGQSFWKVYCPIFVDIAMDSIKRGNGLQLIEDVRRAEISCVYNRVTALQEFCDRLPKTIVCI